MKLVKPYVMLHHSLTKDTDTVSWKAIEKYHREVKHFMDIGYHYGVEKIQGHYYALVGRGVYLPAAACKEGGMNLSATHIMLCGNFDLAPPPREMIDVLVARLLIPICRENEIVDASKIVTHNAYATYKTCPGKQFPMDLVRELVSEKL